MAISVSLLSSKCLAKSSFQNEKAKRNRVLSKTIKCTQEATPSSSAPSNSPATLLPRRSALLSVPTVTAAAAAMTLPTLVHPVRAEEAEFVTYSRGARKRFETSISSAVRPYELQVPKTWGEDVVSLNDGKLYGVDLRYSGKSDGQLAVSVLPYANRDSITEAGEPEKALSTFIELVGAFWDENGFGDTSRLLDVVDTKVDTSEDGVVYYRYELRKPRSLIVANATDGQLYVLNVSGNSRQWKTAESTLKYIADSFVVPPLPNF